MKNGYKEIITSQALRTILFFLLVYFSQVSPFYHLHHFHQDDSLEFELSSHPVAVDVDHASEHDHDKPHSNDHQHTFDNQIDWHIVRTQSSQNRTFETDIIISEISIFKPNNFSVHNSNNFKPSLIDSYVRSTIIIRGPPPLS